MYALLRYTSIPLLIFEDQEDEGIIEYLHKASNKNDEKTSLNVRDSYVSMLEFIANLVGINYEEKIVKNLSKCHVSSGKVMWLCDTHQKQPRITVLDSDDIHVTIDSPNESDNLLEMIKENNETNGKESRLSRRDTICSDFNFSMVQFSNRDTSSESEEEQELDQKQEEKNEQCNKTNNNEIKNISKTDEQNKREATVSNLIAKGGRTKSRACNIS